MHYLKPLWFITMIGFSSKLQVSVTCYCENSLTLKLGNIRSMAFCNSCLGILKLRGSMTSQITISVGQPDPNNSKFGNLTGQIISNFQFFVTFLPFGHILSGAIALHPVAFGARRLLNEKEQLQSAIFHSLDIMHSGQFHRSVRICRGNCNNNCYGGYYVTPAAHLTCTCAAPERIRREGIYAYL